MSDLFRVSLRQVVRQRGFGVILSIALGIMAFIALSVLGQEIRYKVGQDMVLMGGVNIIRVYMDDEQYPGQPRREFYPDTVQAIRDIPGVGMVSQNLRMNMVFPLRGTDERTLPISFIGVDEFFAPTYSLELVAGRFLTAEGGCAAAKTSLPAGPGGGAEPVRQSPRGRGQAPCAGTGRL